MSFGNEDGKLLSVLHRGRGKWYHAGGGVTRRTLSAELSSAELAGEHLAKRAHLTAPLRLP